MSIDYQTYVGPIVRCRFVPVAIDVPHGARCGKCDTKGESEFCPKCGHAMTAIFAREMRPPDAVLDLYEEGVGDLMAIWPEKVQAGEHLYHLNATPAAPQRDFDISDPEHFESLPEGTRRSDIAWMEANAATEIAQLRAAYGPENVTLDWGVWAWVS